MVIILKCCVSHAKGKQVKIDMTNKRTTFDGIVPFENKGLNAWTIKIWYMNMDSV